MFIYKTGNYRETWIYRDGKICIYRKDINGKIRLDVEIQATEEQAQKLKLVLTKDHSEKPYLFKLPRRQVKRKLKLKGWKTSLRDVTFFVHNPNY
jgi:hypothetical protein